MRFGNQSDLNRAMTFWFFCLNWTRVVQFHWTLGAIVINVTIVIRAQKMVVSVLGLDPIIWIKISIPEVVLTKLINTY